MESSSGFDSGVSEDSEWDLLKTTVTAWSTANNKMHRGRRGYGRSSNAAPLELAVRRKRRARHQHSDDETHETTVVRRLSDDRCRGGDSFAKSSQDSSEIMIPSPLGVTRRSSIRSDSEVTSLPRAVSDATVDSGCKDRRAPLARKQSRRSRQSKKQAGEKFSRSYSFGYFSSNKDDGSGRISPNFPVNSENLHPNAPPSDCNPNDIGSASKRKKNMHSRRERTPSPAFSTHSSSSFTSLAKSGDVASSWANGNLQDLETRWNDSLGTEKNGLEEEHKHGDYVGSAKRRGTVGDLASFSPAATTTPSSGSTQKKRGVCSSPGLDRDQSSNSLDISSSEYGGSNSQMNRSGHSAPRPLLRSICFTSELNSSPDDAGFPRVPPSSNSRRIKHRSQGSAEHRQKKKMAPASAQSTSPRLLEADIEDDDVFVNPPKPIRQQSSNFDDVVFGSAGKEFDTEMMSPTPALHQVTRPEVAREADATGGVSSKHDLVFLYKALYKMDKNKKKYGALAFGTNCTILPPTSWKLERRQQFLKWATQGLGFSLRSAGAGTDYLQMPWEKATETQHSLGSLLHSLKQEKKKKEAREEIADMKDVPIEVLQPSGPLSAVIAQETPIPTSIISTTQVDILPNFGSLKIDDDPEVHQDVSLVTTFTELCSEAPAEKSPKETHVADSSWISGVSQQQLPAEVPNRDPMMNICFSPHETSFEIQRQPRHSGGNTLRWQDLMLPCNSAISKATDLNLSRESHQSSVGLRNCRIYEAVDDASVGYQNTGASCITSTSFTSVGLIETPMPKRHCQYYGAHAALDKDWGTSSKCDPTVIEALQRIFDEAQASVASAPSDSFFFSEDIKRRHSTPAALSCAGLGSFVEARIIESDLGFDHEASHESLDIGVDDIGSITENTPTRFSAQRKASGHDRRRSFTSHHHKSHRHYYGTRKDLSRQSSPIPTSLMEYDGTANDESSEWSSKQRKSIAMHHRISLSSASIDVRMPRRFTTIHGGGVPIKFAPMSPRTSAFAIDPETRACHSVLSDDEPSSEVCLPLFSEKEIVGRYVHDERVLSAVFDFLAERDLLCCVSLVCTSWANTSAYSLAKLMLLSVGCSPSLIPGANDDVDDEVDEDDSVVVTPDTDNQQHSALERSWSYLNETFPWGTFLSEGAFKQVYRVWNGLAGGEEAVSVMDVNLIDSTGNKSVIGTELAVSGLLSSLARRNLCPNFVITRGVFTCDFAPPSSLWGTSCNKAPQGVRFDPSARLRKIRKPKASERGRYQYIRMELCRFGDVEEFIAKQPGRCIDPLEGQHLLFQMAFALHAASDRFGMKHYDVKCLNYFLQSANDADIDEMRYPFTVLRYGVGEHVFRLRMRSSRALVAKLADYGTANLHPESNGQQVTLGQFTTLENSPPEQLLLGDAAVQGFGHDMFGLGLCMLHLFTGDAPYEEILCDVKCPPTLMKNLRKHWENSSSQGFSVLRSVILADVYEDADGQTDGEVDETLYHTLYRYLVLFGLPKEMVKRKECKKVWKAISSSLGEDDFSPLKANNTDTESCRKAKTRNAKKAPDASIFHRDRSTFSLSHGSEKRISSAREKLTNMEGGLDLLNSLVTFDPDRRASALDVLNSAFMASLRESCVNDASESEDIVYSYMSYFTRSNDR